MVGQGVARAWRRRVLSTSAGGDRPLILFAIQELDSGGPDRVLFELLTHLPRDRFRLGLIVGKGGGRYFDSLPLDVEKTVIGGGRYPVRRLARAIDAFRPAILFTTLRMNLTAAFATMISRHRPVFISRQANAIASDFAILKQQSRIKHRLAEQVTLFSLRRADAVVAQADDMATEIARHVSPRQRIATIGNPADIPSIEALAIEQAHSVATPVGNPAIISVGRLMPQKGYDILVRALPAILEVHPGAEITILGDGAQRDALEALAQSLGVSTAFHLPGQSAQALGAVRQADLFVSSSRYEGFPNVILEAMAVGTPVAATKCPGTGELVIDGETGWLAPTIDEQALAAAILSALAGNGAARASAARRHIERRFARNIIISAYSDLFGDMLATHA